eukprot:scaffold94652_cov36-Tisochrysis_lutea.AAC.2
MARCLALAPLLLVLFATGAGALTPGLHRVVANRVRVSALRMADDAPAISAPSAYIEFMVGVPEPVVPDVKLTRSRDGSTGVATFTFDAPSFLSAASADLGETTGVNPYAHPR